MDNEKQILGLMIDIQKVFVETLKAKDRIIKMLIICMFLEAVSFAACFAWYESQFEYTDTVTETIETDNHTESNKDIDISSEGDSAEATYIDGNQYNDESVHNEEGKKDDKGGDR